MITILLWYQILDGKQTDDEQLTGYARLYTNQMCKLIMKEYRETPSHGKPKAPTYELLQIQDINN